MCGISAMSVGATRELSRFSILSLKSLTVLRFKPVTQVLDWFVFVNSKGNHSLAAIVFMGQTKSRTRLNHWDSSSVSISIKRRQNLQSAILYAHPTRIHFRFTFARSP